MLIYATPQLYVSGRKMANDRALIYQKMRRERGDERLANDGGHIASGGKTKRTIRPWTTEEYNGRARQGQREGQDEGAKSQGNDRRSGRLIYREKL